MLREGKAQPHQDTVAFFGYFHPQICYGPTLALNYGVGGWEPGQDPRTPDIIVTPNVGVTYSASTTMIEDHGIFAKPLPGKWRRQSSRLWD